jgi:hypothetical protein
VVLAVLVVVLQVVGVPVVSGECYRLTHYTNYLLTLIESMRTNTGLCLLPWA